MRERENPDTTANGPMWGKSGDEFSREAKGEKESKCEIVFLDTKTPVIFGVHGRWRNDLVCGCHACRF